MHNLNASYTDTSSFILITRIFRLRIKRTWRNTSNILAGSVYQWKMCRIKKRRSTSSQSVMTTDDIPKKESTDAHGNEQQLVEGCNDQAGKGEGDHTIATNKSIEQQQLEQKVSEDQVSAVRCSRSTLFKIRHIDLKLASLLCVGSFRWPHPSAPLTLFEFFEMGTLIFWPIKISDLQKNSLRATGKSTQRIVSE